MDEESDLQPPSAVESHLAEGTQPEAVRRHGSARADSGATSEGSHAQADSVDSERTGVDAAQGTPIYGAEHPRTPSVERCREDPDPQTVLADDDDENGTGAHGGASGGTVRDAEPSGVGEAAGRSGLQDTAGEGPLVACASGAGDGGALRRLLQDAKRGAHGVLLTCWALSLVPGNARPMSIGEARLQQLSGGTATLCRHPHERSAASQDRDFKHISEKFARDFPLQREHQEVCPLTIGHPLR